MPDNKLFEDILPRTFCREYAQIKQGTAQLGMFMAVVLGIKPLMDDWIPVRFLKEFKKICRNYGLKIREDVLFRVIAKDGLRADIIGREFLTTTSAYGYPLNSPEGEQVHLFISKDAGLLKKGMWYPLIINKRVVFQPRIDSLKYGYVLGYPDCCIRFFRKYNDWRRYSYLYEAFRNTLGRPSVLCNPFFKDVLFSYIYHMPCRYNCQATVRLAGKLRQEIFKREPAFVKLVDQRLRAPFLVFYERKFYYFEGRMAANEICYQRLYFPSPDFTKDVYGKYLRRADRLRLEGCNLILFKGEDVIRKIFLEPRRGFAPEYPFLIQFI